MINEYSNRRFDFSSYTFGHQIALADDSCFERPISLYNHNCRYRGLRLDLPSTRIRLDSPCTWPSWLLNTRTNRFGSGRHGGHTITVEYSWTLLFLTYNYSRCYQRKKYRGIFKRSSYSITLYEKKAIKILKRYKNYSVIRVLRFM